MSELPWALGQPVRRCLGSLGASGLERRRCLGLSLQSGGVTCENTHACEDGLSVVMEG